MAGARAPRRRAGARAAHRRRASSSLRLASRTRFITASRTSGKTSRSGHRVIGTVYVEAYESGWRKTGPEAMRPVGEVELVARLTAAPVQTPHRPVPGRRRHRFVRRSHARRRRCRGHRGATEGRRRGACAACVIGRRPTRERWEPSSRTSRKPHRLVRPRVQTWLRATRAIRTQLRCLDLPHAARRAHRPRRRIPEHDHRARPRRARRSGLRSSGRSAAKSSRSGGRSCMRWPPGRTYG